MNDAIVAAAATVTPTVTTANTAAEEHAAELARGPEASIGDDPLAAVEGETHGTDADAGEYLNPEAADHDGTVADTDLADDADETTDGE